MKHYPNPIKLRRYGRPFQHTRRRFALMLLFCVTLSVLVILSLEEMNPQRAVGAIHNGSTAEVSQHLAETSQFRLYERLNQLSEELQQPLLQLELIKSQNESKSLNQNDIYYQINFVQRLIRISQNYSNIPAVAQIVDWVELQDISEETVDRAINAEQKTWALGYLGYLLELKNQLQSAEQKTQQALEIAESLGKREITYKWEWQLGRIYKAQGNLERAIVFYDAAYRDIQALRQELVTLERSDQFIFRDRVEPLYREYVDLVLQDPQWQRKQVNNDVRDIREVITSLQIAELETFLECNLQVETEEYARIDEVVDHVAETSSVLASAVIYPIILNDRLEVLLKLPNQKKLERSTKYIPAENIKDTLNQLRYYLEKPYFSTKHGEPLARTVYDWLIKPFEDQQLLSYNTIKTLIFVLDGEFRNIPMAALCSQGQGNRCGQYLIQKYAVATAPNLKIPASSPQRRFRALIGGLAESNDVEFGSLPYVNNEIEDIQQYLNNADVLSNHRFTQSELRRANLSSYDVIHFATHSEFGSDRDKTFILTADQRIDLNELSQLFQLETPDAIELLVLSSCETAASDDREVLGIAGMTVQVGARSTLATLWSLQDSSTATLMRQFYQGWVKQGLTKAEALRQAQLTLLQNNPAFKPTHWAPYVLVGDWR